MFVPVWLMILVLFLAGCVGIVIWIEKNSGGYIDFSPVVGCGMFLALLVVCLTLLLIWRW
jgi:hypothetical protein